MPKLNTLWTIWKYSLGSFSDDKTQEYDNHIALLRTVIFVSYLITNCFIIAGVIRHYDNQQVQCGVSTTEEQNRVLE